jgi:hypothetical protein
MQLTHLSHVSVVLVAKAAVNEDTSLIRFFPRLQDDPGMGEKTNTDKI